MEQAGVVLVDGGEGVLDVPEGGVENEVDDTPLLVGEERSERVVNVAVVAIEKADDAWEVSALHLVGGLPGEIFKACGVGIRVGLDGGGDVLVAEVEDGKGEGLIVAGNGAGDVGAAEARRPRPEVAMS